MSNNQEHIMEHVGAEKWSWVTEFFGGMDYDEVLAELNKMYPYDENEDLAQKIVDELN